MTTMVERVAKAIYEIDPQTEQEVDTDGRPLGPKYKVMWGKLAEYDDGFSAFYRDAARAAIAAMREPTEAMVTGKPQ